ncbi:MAG TPA: hypothetical protein VGF25_11295, partial [Thermoleophilaceae bacterium]
GETWTYTASGVALTGQYENTATVTGLDVLENNLSDTDPSHYLAALLPPPLPPPLPPAPKPKPKPKLVLKKRADRNPARSGKLVRYRLKVTNKGRGTARRVTVCDPLPKGLVLAGASRSGRIHGNRACFKISKLGPHRSRTFTVRAYPTLAEHTRTICNVASRSARGVKVRRTRECIRVLPSTAGACPVRSLARPSRRPDAGPADRPRARVSC